VQFETKADVQKALSRNGATLGNSEITVSLPFGLQTCTTLASTSAIPYSLSSPFLPIQRRVASVLLSTRNRATSLEMRRQPPSCSARKVCTLLSACGVVRACSGVCVW
jgi:hypothetical protein